MATGKISVQTENIFPIIKKFLYSDQEIFLRELIANAVDATQKLKTLASKGVFSGDLGDLSIEITLDKEAKTLSIVDRGVGLSGEEAEKYLNQVAFSSAQEFIEQYKDDSTIIGHFGLGFYSAFMVADKVEVNSLSYHDEQAIQWSCEGNPEYSLEKISKESRGTEVKLHISEDAVEYLEESKIQELLDKYCKFLPIPIVFGEEEFALDVETKEGEEAPTETRPKVINNPHPIWKKSPSDLEDKDYEDFYQELHPHTPKPLFWIHLNIDYPFNLTGILYFPKLKNNLDVQNNKIHLYANQVFVTDEVREIVPEFLQLLHGVIDSPDIPLNVSRSYLQSDSNVKKISSYITKKVSEKLKSLFKDDRKLYEEKWDEINMLVKYGLISDEKFYDRTMDANLFKNIDSEYFTLEEYKEKLKETQVNKHDKTVMIYTSNPKQHDSFIQAARAKSYDVLICDTVLDNHLMQQIEYKNQDLVFVRVDSTTVDKLVEKDEVIESVLSEKEQEKIKEIFEAGIEKHKEKINLEALSPSEHPVLITRPEFMRRMKEMQNLQGMDMGGMEFFDVVVNTNHPLIASKLIKMRSPEKKERFARYLFDLARLNQNMLEGEEMTAFIKSSLEFLEN